MNACETGNAFLFLFTQIYKHEREKWKKKTAIVRLTNESKINMCANNGAGCWLGKRDDEREMRANGERCARREGQVRSRWSKVGEPVSGVCRLTGSPRTHTHLRLLNQGTSSLSLAVAHRFFRKRPKSGAICQTRSRTHMPTSGMKNASASRRWKFLMRTHSHPPCGIGAFFIAMRVLNNSSEKERKVNANSFDASASDRLPLSSLCLCYLIVAAA